MKNTEKGYHIVLSTTLTKPCLTYLQPVDSVSWKMVTDIVENGRVTLTVQIFIIGQDNAQLVKVSNTNLLF